MAAEKIRSFWALSLTEDSIKQIEEKLLISSFPKESIRLVNPSHWHITLQFLGDQSGRTLDSLAETIEGHAGIPTLLNKLHRVEVLGLSGFPRFKRAYILALRFGEGAGNIRKLYRRIIDATKDRVKPEDRPFKAHMTLGRAKTRRPFDMELLEWPDFYVELDSLTLFASSLTPQGPEYKILYRKPIKKH